MGERGNPLPRKCKFAQQRQGPLDQGAGRRKVMGPAQVFVGTFEHSLDDKGRVVLPSTFRSHLADKGFISQLDDCLGLWTEDGFTEVATLLTQKVRDGLAPQDAIRAFSSAAAEVRPDTQGRVTDPAAPAHRSRFGRRGRRHRPHRTHRDLGCVALAGDQRDGGPEPDRSRPGPRSLSRHQLHAAATGRNTRGKGSREGRRRTPDGAEAPRSSVAP